MPRDRQVSHVPTEWFDGVSGGVDRWDAADDDRSARLTGPHESDATIAGPGAKLTSLGGVFKVVEPDALSASCADELLETDGSVDRTGRRRSMANAKQAAASRKLWDSDARPANGLAQSSGTDTRTVTPEPAAGEKAPGRAAKSTEGKKPAKGGLLWGLIPGVWKKCIPDSVTAPPGEEGEEWEVVSEAADSTKDSAEAMACSAGEAARLQEGELTGAAQATSVEKEPMEAAEDGSATEAQDTATVAHPKETGVPTGMNIAWAAASAAHGIATIAPTKEANVPTGAHIAWAAAAALRRAETPKASAGELIARCNEELSARLTEALNDVLARRPAAPLKSMALHLRTHGKAASGEAAPPKLSKGVLLDKSVAEYMDRNRIGAALASIAAELQGRISAQIDEHTLRALVECVPGMLEEANSRGE